MESDKQRKVIAVCGRKKHGKNTAAEVIISLLRRNANTTCYQFAFADRLKQEVCEAYGITRIELEANKDFWRPVLQFWGTEFRRIYQKQDNYWVNHLHGDLTTFFFHYHNYPNAVAIITDCRYPNESVFLRENYDTKFFWIERSSVKLDINSNHASETSITKKDCQYHINNNGTITELEEELYVNLRAAKLL